MVPPFDKSQLPKCHDRLEKAKVALYRCRNAHDFSTFTSAWADLLIYTGAVIHAVEGGAQGTPQGRQWYGGVKRRDRSDELIRYMYQARNEEEHGRQSTTGYNPMPGMGLINPETNLLEPFRGANLATGEVQADGSIVYQNDPNERERMKGWKIGIGAVPTGPVLVPVHDSKFDKRYPPPSTHKGKRLKVNTPVDIGEVYLYYLTELIEEAASLS